MHSKGQGDLKLPPNNSQIMFFHKYLPDTETKKDASNDVKKEQYKDHGHVWILKHEDLQNQSNLLC